MRETGRGSGRAWEESLSNVRRASDPKRRQCARRGVSRSNSLSRKQSVRYRLPPRPLGQHAHAAPDARPARPSPSPSTRAPLPAPTRTPTQTRAPTRASATQKPPCRDRLRGPVLVSRRRRSAPFARCVGTRTKTIRAGRRTPQKRAGAPAPHYTALAHAAGAAPTCMSRRSGGTYASEQSRAAALWGEGSPSSQTGGW